MHKDIFILRIMHNYLGRSLAYIFMALSSFITAGYLTTEDFGRLGILAAAVLFGAAAIDLGIPSFMLRYCGEYAEKKENSKLAAIFAASVLGAFILGSLLLLVLYSLFFSGALKHAVSLGYIWLVALFAVFRFLCQVTEIYLSVFFRERLKNAVLIFASGVKLLLIIIAVRLKASLTVIFWVSAAPDILMAAFYSVFIQKSLSVSFLRVSLKEAATEFSGKSGFIFREYVFKWLGFFWEFRFDLFVALYFFTLSSIGNYAFAMTIVSVLSMWAPDTVLQSMLRNFMVRTYASKNDTEGLCRFFKSASTMRIFFMAPLIFAAAVFIGPVVSLFFAGKYAGAVSVFLAFSPFLIFKVLINPIREVLVVADRNDIPLKSNFALLYKFASIAVFVPLFGLTSLSFISGSFFLIVFLIHFFSARKIIKLTFEWAKAAKIIINSSLSGLLAYLLLKRYGTHIQGVIFSLAAMASAYILLNFFTKAFSFREYGLFIPAESAEEARV